MPPVPNTPHEFFHVWLPLAFEPFAAELGQQSSPGALVFHVGELSPIAIRVERGKLGISSSVPADTIAQIRLSEGAFEPIIVRAAEHLSLEKKGAEPHLLVLRALTLDAERVALIRGVAGSVAFALKADALTHQLLLTPGTQQGNPLTPECTVRCELSDFLAMQRGETNPFELMMSGKIAISGDAQIPMALSSLLV